MNRKAAVKLLVLGAVLCAAVFVAIWKGSTDVSLAAIFSDENRQILHLRLARIVLGFLTGAGLGLCGVTFQAVLRNPLAEPYLLGTSSGAGLGAVIAIMLGIPGVFLPAVAFGGALLSIYLVYNLAKEDGRISVQSLILSGVIVSMALSGIIVFLISLSSNEALHGIIWWLLGGLEVYDVRLLISVGVIVVVGIIAIFFFSQDLNAISIGEEEAIHLGIEAESLKKILFIIASLITGALVSVSGLIGFVGLIIPHMMRLVVGPNHKILVPATVLGAGAFLVICDTLSRPVFPPVEIPIGVITSLIGAPLFIFLLKKKQKIS